jgi:hypothetical protein
MRPHHYDVAKDILNLCNHNYPGMVVYHIGPFERVTQDVIQSQNDVLWSNAYPNFILRVFTAVIITFTMSL